MRGRLRDAALLIAGILSAFGFIGLLEITRPGLDGTPPATRRDATALFWTELETLPDRATFSIRKR